MPSPMDETLERIEVLLRASVALQLDSRERELNADATRRIEVVLNDAGLSAREIALLVGKNYEAVRKTIARSRASNQESDA